MATLTRQALVPTGVAITYTAANGGGDVVDVADEKTVLHVKNGGGVSINVTLTSQVPTLPVDGYGTVARADIVVAVPNGQERMIGPIPRIAFANVNGQVPIAYSGVTSVTVAAIKLP